MGSSLSSCACNSRYCLDQGQHQPSIPTTIKFYAEIFELTNEHKSWRIVHPSILKITVKKLSQRCCSAQLTATADNSNVLINLFIRPSSQVKRASSYFVYWKSNDIMYGMNIVSSEDCDNFCQLLTEIKPEREVGNESISFPAQLTVRIAKIFSSDSSIQKTIFHQCTIVFNSNQIIFRIDSEQFTINLPESIMVIGEMRERFYISEPNHIYAIECDTHDMSRYLITKLLNISSFSLSRTLSVANTAHYLQKQISSHNDKINTDVLSKLSLETLRNLGSFGCLTICTLHLHFLAKYQFKMQPTTDNTEIQQSCEKALAKCEAVRFSVHIPSGEVFQFKGRFTTYDQVLEKVCQTANLDRQEHFMTKIDENYYCLMENQYRIHKSGKNLGITICAKNVNGIVQAEVCSVRNKATMAQIGDVIISVDDHNVAELKTAEEVECLLRSATSLMMGRVPRKPMKSHQKMNTSSSNTEECECTINTPSLSTRLEGQRKFFGAKVNSLGKAILNETSIEDGCTSSTNSWQFSEANDEQLHKTINELVVTEENFVRDVEKLVNHYLKPTSLTILETADRLLHVQKSFLSALRDAAGDVAHEFNASAEQLRDSIIRISTLFINKCNKFKIYSDYSAAYLRFQQEKESNSGIEEVLSRKNLSGEQSDSAQSLLIKPIQRVLKYPLFMQQIRDNCLEGSIERQQVEQALKRMHALADYVNEMQRITELYGPIIDEISAKSISQSRMKLSELLMFANINWLNCSENRSRPIICVAFVFSTLILIYCPSLSKNKNRLYRILPIREIEINENITDSKDSEILFVLIHIGKSHETVYHLCCSDSEIKNHFIKSIRKAASASDIMKEARRPVSGSSQSDGGYSSERQLL